MIFLLHHKYFKRIVSRDFVVIFLVSFDRSDISTHQEWFFFAFKSSFSYRIFRFSCMGVVTSGSKMVCNFTFKYVYWLKKGRNVYITLCTVHPLTVTLGQGDEGQKRRGRTPLGPANSIWAAPSAIRPPFAVILVTIERIWTPVFWVASIQQMERNIPHE
jgi:hypothetical protein